MDLELKVNKKWHKCSLFYAYSKLCYFFFKSFEYEWKLLISNYFECNIFQTNIQSNFMIFNCFEHNKDLLSVNAFLDNKNNESYVTSMLKESNIIYFFFKYTQIRNFANTTY